jgi:hypothetical protein
MPEKILSAVTHPDWRLRNVETNAVAVFTIGKPQFPAMFTNVNGSFAAVDHRLITGHIADLGPRCSGSAESARMLHNDDRIIFRQQVGLPQASCQRRNAGRQPRSAQVSAAP